MREAGKGEADILVALGHVVPDAAAQQKLRLFTEHLRVVFLLELLGIHVEQSPEDCCCCPEKGPYSQRPPVPPCFLRRRRRPVTLFLAPPHAALASATLRLRLDSGPGHLRSEYSHKPCRNIQGQVLCSRQGRIKLFCLGPTPGKHSTAACSQWKRGVWGLVVFGRTECHPRALTNAAAWAGFCVE